MKRGLEMARLMVDSMALALHMVSGPVVFKSVRFIRYQYDINDMTESY